MKRPPVHPAISPKTLTLRAVAEYLQLGSPQAAQRWLDASHVHSFIDPLGYRRAWLKDIDAALLTQTAQAETLPSGRRIA